LLAGWEIRHLDGPIAGKISRNRRIGGDKGRTEARRGFEGNDRPRRRITQPRPAELHILSGMPAKTLVAVEYQDGFRPAYPEQQQDEQQLGVMDVIHIRLLAQCHAKRRDEAENSSSPPSSSSFPRIESYHAARSSL
jgi:hypothetical protein